MEHLVLHLAEECRLGGPVHYRWMYPFERLLKFMKDKVKNKARVEGSIAEQYVEEETVNFCSFYFKSNVDTVHNTVRRNEVVVEKQDDSILEVFRYPIKCGGKQVVRYLDDDEHFIAEYYVLLNMPEVQPYIREYASYTRATPEQLESLLKTHFKVWFKNKIENDVEIYPRFKDLLHGPARTTFTNENCKVNGYKFYCRKNSGVLVKGTSHANILENYYGQLEEIVTLIYRGGNQVYLFKCRWFDSVGSGVRVDRNRVVIVDIKSRLRSNEVFVLASQVSQVYYAPSVLNPRSNLYTVVSIKKSQLDESTTLSTENPYQEEISNTSTSISLLVDFAQYEPIPRIRPEYQGNNGEEDDDNECDEEFDEENQGNEDGDEDEEDEEGYEDIQ